MTSCPFFQKFKDLEVEEVDRLKSLYCKGPYMDQCVRKLYKELHGVDAIDQMSPEGNLLECQHPGCRIEKVATGF